MKIESADVIIEIPNDDVARSLAYEPVEVQREFIQTYLEEIAGLMLSEKQMIATYGSIFLELGPVVKKALKAGL